MLIIKLLLFISLQLELIKLFLKEFLNMTERITVVLLINAVIVHCILYSQVFITTQKQVVFVCKNQTKSQNIHLDKYTLLTRAETVVISRHL